MVSEVSSIGFLGQMLLGFIFPLEFPKVGVTDVEHCHLREKIHVMRALPVVGCCTWGGVS